MLHKQIENASLEQGFGDENVIFFYLTGVGFEVKERKAKYAKKGKKKAS